MQSDIFPRTKRAIYRSNAATPPQTFSKKMIMIKEKLDNERMEQLSHHVLNDCKDEKLSARDE